MDLNFAPQQVRHLAEATIKAAPAAGPGAATLLADYAGLIEKPLNVSLIALSIAFLLWRWRVAWRREHEGRADDQ